MIKSVNQIRLELAEIQATHLQLNSFFWGDFLRAYKENRLNYPLMGAFYPTSTLLRNQTQLQLRIYIADKLYKDWSNLNDIESDTLQTCRDVFNIMNNSTRWQTIGRVQSCSVTKFINRGGDEVAGHEMTINFLIRDREGVCGLPMEGYDFDQVTGSLCSPVQIYEDGILIATVPSGGTYTVVGSPATQVITDSDGNELYSNSIPSGVTETQVIQDSTYTVEYVNGALIESGSILAEGSVTVQVPDPIVCEDVDVFVGEALVGTYSGGTDVFVTVTQDGLEAIPEDVVVTGNDINIVLADTPDTTLEVNGTTEGTFTAGSTIDVQLSDSGGVVTPTSVTVVGNDVQVLLPDAPTPSYGSARLQKSGVTTSYADYDAGYYQRGRSQGFFKLPTTAPNPFGHTWRFTGKLGGYYDQDTIQYKLVDGTISTLAGAFPDSIMIDWSTREAGAVQIWALQTFALPSVTWDLARTNCEALTVGGISTWALPETVEYDSLRNWGLASHFGWFPLNYEIGLWSANTNPSSITVAFYKTGIQWAGSGKANAFKYIPTRWTLLTELGL